MKLFTDAAPVVRWFTKQQKYGGGYGSTQVGTTPPPQRCQYAARVTWCSLDLLVSLPLQATIMVYQAVAEYWANSKEPEYDVNVDVLMPGRSSPEKYKVNRENHYTTRTTKVKSYGLTQMQLYKPEFNLLIFASPIRWIPSIRMWWWRPQGLEK